MQGGQPVGSRTLSRQGAINLSPASIRNVMQDLEYLGLLDHPHVSAGRMPTQLGLRLFVDGLMEAGPVSATDREMIDETLGRDSGDTGAMMDRVSTALSALTHGASLVLMPKQEAPLRHIEFVGLAPDRALVVLVFADGQVENRVFAPPPGRSSMAWMTVPVGMFFSGRLLPGLMSADAPDSTTSPCCSFAGARM